MNRYCLPFFALFSGLLALQSCSTSPATTDDNTTAPRVVKTVAVVPLQYRETIKASGQLALAEEARLSFKTGGVIRKVYVREGQQVQAGQLLAEIELDEINARAQQAKLGKAQGEITVENANLALRLAARDYRNTQGLYADSVATLEQLENAEVQLDNARNQLKLAERAQGIQEQQQEVADYNLRHAKIFAPAAGTILKKLAEPNEMVGPGMPVLLFGSREKAFVIRVSATDKDIVHLNLGDPATITFDAYPERAFQGTVRELAGMADPYTGTFEVEVQVEAEGARLRSGFIGSVTIQSRQARPLLAIPVDALKVANGDQGVVFTAANGKANRRTVDIYRLQGTQLLLKSGLDSTDRVIINGLSFLQDGTPVSVK
ncbi:MAG: efflux RND transporter periplasmic adaptor subunit [Phaeodactylibacter sp.]|uniref:efflux RND transporter periplasmic adaptor subunit n=1 Tax=Phaeodactylibacter sp. TaxID=1940289 RepID=UPI0032EB42F1